MPEARCPTCSRPSAPRSENRAFPFCSERCRMIDLSKWLGEDYRIPGPPAAPSMPDPEA